jgi:uncharacterized protein (TIGR02302 family)
MTPTALSRDLERKIRLARLVLFWERFWPALLPLLLVLGTVAAAALFGLFEFLSRPLHLATLVLLLIAVAVATRPLLALTWPDRDAALRRLETVAGLPHRPASSYADTLNESASAGSLAVWRVHKKRLRAMFAALRPGLAQPDIPARDPWALRAVVGLMLVTALAWAGPDTTDRLRGVFVPPASKAAAAQIWIDAWVTPPAYTGRAPVFLSGTRPTATAAQTDRPIDVAVNSELVIRVTGATDPAATSGEIAGPPEGDAGHSDNLAFRDAGGGVRELRLQITDSGQTRVSDGADRLAAWRFDVIPDTLPVIRLDGDIATTEDQALRFSYTVEDDYGVVAAEADLELVRNTPEPGDEADKGDSGAVLETTAPDFALVLPSARVKSATESVYRDLTAHPWAGLKVRMTLMARDEAGQVARTEPAEFRLPERRFVKPLARALIEQRRNLVYQRDAAPKVARALQALTIVPEKHVSDSVVYLGMTTARYRLEREPTSQTMSEVVDLLWDLALRIEDGDLSHAERELRAAQEALRRALAENAPREEIERLMAELRKALDRFMQAMAEQLQRNAQNQQLQQIPPGAQMIRPQDLNRMMDMIENLAKSGARDAAQELLAQMNRLLENLRAGVPMQGNPNQQQSQMSRMLDQLGELMGKQQELMDRTFRQGQNEQGNQEGGAQSQDQMSLAEQQQALRDMLGRLMDQLGQNGGETPSPLGRADGAMGEATGNLQQGRNGEATGNQGEAIDQLRQGANSLARQMMEGMGQTGQMGQRGIDGETEVDPLGRPLRSTGQDPGASTKVPTEIDIQRAREIMQELQRRLGERTRPTLELDYLERLLRRF